MKNTILFALLITQLFLTKAVAGPTGGGGSGGSGGTGASAAPANTPVRTIGNPVTPLNPTTPVAPVTSGNGNVLPNQTPQPGSLDGQNAGQLNPNGTMGTNNLATMTNQMVNTNTLVGTSNNPPTITTSNGTIVSKDANGNPIITDQAVTASDRVLLTTLSQGVKTTLGITPNGNLPVHFMINNGTVTVVGTVQSPAQSQNLLSQVRQTPGVIGVVSDLRVGGALSPAQTSLNGSSVFAGQSDHAFSPRDQTLLTTIQQQTALQLGINNSSQMPIHFSVQNGVVGITGQVSSLQEKQALIAAISRTPGIVRVVDNIGVLNGASSFNNNLPPTSRSFGSNTIFLNSNNASGF